MSEEREESARSILSGIWKQFAADRKEGRAHACARYQRSLAENAEKLIPALITPKEFQAMIFDCEVYTKSDKQSEAGNPVDSMADWLSGKTDLSRVSMMKERN